MEAPQLKKKNGKQQIRFPIMFPTTEEHQWLEHVWNHENMFELVSVTHCARSGGIIGISFRFSLI